MIETTAVAPEVLDAMLPFLRDRYGNPSSMHSFGGDIGRDVERARERLAELLGAEATSEIVFTSCGTESDNTAILSALEATPDRKQVITTRVEHPAVLSLARHLERKGFEVVRIGVEIGTAGEASRQIDVARVVHRHSATLVFAVAAHGTGPHQRALRGVFRHVDVLGRSG